MKSIAAGLALFVCASVLSAQTITLKPNYQPGMSWTFDTTQDMSSDAKATVMGQSQPFNSKQHSRRVGTITVIAVKDGEPSQMKIAFDNGCENAIEMAGQKQTPPFALAGKAITVTRGDDGRATTDMDNQLDPQTLGEVTGMIESAAAMFPNKAVAVGDEWPADAKRLARLLQLQDANDQAGMTLKLLSVKNAPQPTAEVKVSMAVIRNMNGLNVKVISQGTALVDIASGHVMKLEAKGPVTTTGTMQQQTPDGQAMQIQIEGTGTMTTSTDAPLKGTVMAAPAAAGNQLGGGNPLGGGGANPLAKPATPFAGTFSDGKLTLDLTGMDGAYAGTIALGGSKFPANAKAGGKGLEGNFWAGNDKYDFTATLDGDTVTLVSDGTTYTLKRQAPKNPLAK
jgi:hypothetical protein